MKKRIAVLALVIWLVLIIAFMVLAQTLDLEIFFGFSPFPFFSLQNKSRGTEMRNEEKFLSLLKRDGMHIKRYKGIFLVLRFDIYQD